MEPQWQISAISMWGRTKKFDSHGEVWQLLAITKTYT